MRSVLHSQGCFSACVSVGRRISSADSCERRRSECSSGAGVMHTDSSAGNTISGSDGLHGCITSPSTLLLPSHPSVR